MPSFPCPRCGRNFKENSRLLNHINQPYSSCLTHYEEQLEINKALLAQSPSDPEALAKQFDAGFYPDVSMEDATNHLDLFSTNMDLDSAAISSNTSQTNLNIPSPQTSTETRQPPHFKTVFCDASKTYGTGLTFMDQFDRDSFAPERKDHPYFPFASRDEWELASFLLRSNLSMSATDTFLKLKMVST